MNGNFHLKNRAGENVSRETFSNQQVSNAAQAIQLTVRIKNVYGKPLVYPVCEQSKLLAKLADKITFTTEDIKIIEQLGYEFKVETPRLAAGGTHG